MPGDRLLLQVTPPPTATFTQVPPTETPVPPTSTATPVPSTEMATPTATRVVDTQAAAVLESSATALPSPTPRQEKTNPLVIGGVNFFWALPALALVVAVIEWNHKRRQK